MNSQNHVIYICSDSVGETAEAVARATMKQFEADTVTLKRAAHIQTEDEIREIVQKAAEQQALILYTLVQPELMLMMKQEAVKHDLIAVDIMGPPMQAFINTFHQTPNRKPGMLHTMDQDYYNRIEAIEFTVRTDDGKNTSEIGNADIVIIGVSRTSKTPLSLYLAHKGYKVANIPIVPELKPAEMLVSMSAKRIFGLTIHPNQLLQIRRARLHALGLQHDASYATEERIAMELDYAHSIMEKLECPIIDVSNRGIEETAGLILEYV
ncbi:pyruvate, water dikinase regulatory protein [Paenibacillus sp. HB172176]|uniref:pyruvate, water dikinase regulatory protein n=1 Tax=Paenibacillus sp. HB172176 TaxID=2493690 RepID=UPI001438E247|nr:pyruvate, water dikinase regulatory protein [Paenibacillus sp. HB172176]